MNALINVKSPARCANTGTGPNSTEQRRNEVPMAITVQGGVARPHLYEVGNNTQPRIEVPPVIDVDALAAALNAQLNGEPTDEVTGFYAVVAGAFGAGVEHGQTLAGAA